MFARLPRPTSGVVISTLPRGVVMRALVPSMPRSTIVEARTSASAIDPEGDDAAGKRRQARDDAIVVGVGHQQRSSGRRASKISALASAMASSDAKNPRWASPTFVHTRTSGSATRTSVLISPG